MVTRQTTPCRPSPTAYRSTGTPCAVSSSPVLGPPGYQDPSPVPQGPLGAARPLPTLPTTRPKTKTVSTPYSQAEWSNILSATMSICGRPFRRAPTDAPAVCAHPASETIMACLLESLPRRLNDSGLASRLPIALSRGWLVMDGHDFIDARTDLVAVSLPAKIAGLAGQFRITTS